MGMNIAICYDWFDTAHGGMERLLETFQRSFPRADWYGIHTDPTQSAFARNNTIRTTYIDRLPRALKTNHALMLPLYPRAVETLDLSSYDLVVTITSAFMKGVITRPQTRHVCYLLTPPRYLYDQHTHYVSSRLRPVISPLLHSLQTTDYLQAQRPDTILALSKHVQKRCASYYRRASQVLYPSFDTQYWEHIESLASSGSPFESPYYLIVNRLEPYKRTELAIQACLHAGVTPVVIGAGSLRKRLIQRYPKALFLHNITDPKLYRWYTHAQALLMVQEEEFGLTSLEAQFAGCPVITYAHSGAAETILPGKTGTTVDSHTITGIAAAIKTHEQSADVMRKSTRAHSRAHILKTFGQKRFTSTLLEVCSVS